MKKCRKKAQMKVLFQNELRQSSDTYVSTVPTLEVATSYLMCPLDIQKSTRLDEN